MVKSRKIAERTDLATEAGELPVPGDCVTFVYAPDPDGTIETLDTRRMQLALLDRECAKRVWKEFRGRGRCADMELLSIISWGRHHGQRALWVR